MKCAVCEAEGGFRVFSAREMMFGWRHPFNYGECPECGTLQIEQVPANLGDYYQAGYYSLAAPAMPVVSASRLRRWLACALLDWRFPLSASVVRGMRSRYPFLQWARVSRAGVNAAILDVGCGSGDLLRRLRLWGFANLTGVDPYTSHAEKTGGFEIRRAELAEIAGAFDLIMMHHVLEHVAAPVCFLEQARERLRPDGRILVRLPLAGSLPAQEYGADWFALDPPRHLVIPSKRGMQRLAERAGLRIIHVEFDSTEQSFLMSECYRRDVSLKDVVRHDQAKVRQGREWARTLNRSGEADCGVFVLGKR